ncbi:MAG: hypothetical protein ABIA83_02055 [Patescibacteria group bacterium]
MTEEDEAIMEFHDTHNHDSKHRFKGEITVWLLERPAQEEQGPDPAVRAYVHSLRDRTADTAREANSSRTKIKVVRPR